MNSRHGHEMRFGVLGPVEVLRDDVALELGPRQRRLLLVRLLIEDGRPVSQDTLLNDLWPTDRPTGAASSVRAHVSRLRAVLDPVRQGLLVSGPSGYALKVPREARDTTLFEEAVGRARDALRARQLPVARQEIDAALVLWRGEALAEAGEHAFAIRERARLDAALDDAKELRATILVQQGETELAIDVAEGLVLKAPLRETSWALLMRALYAAGRPVEALKQYERFRDMLATELGLDPSPQLRDLHTAVLRHDVAVLGTAVTGASLPPRPAVTARRALPAPFVGRAVETARLDVLLAAGAAGRPQWAVIDGGQGAGKTRLLDEVAARAAAAGFTVARTRAGQALSGNRGISQTCPTVQLLDALRQDGKDSAEDEVAQKDPLATVVDELTQGPTLVVVDDLDRAPQGFHRLLRRLSQVLREAPVVFVCTLRNPDAPVSSVLLADLALLGATWLTLAPLTIDDVAELLAAQGEFASPTEVAALHRRSEGHPFTLVDLLALPPGRRTGPDARIPAAVRNILHARLLELPDAARTMLAFAAADGEWLDVGLLADAQGLAPEELLPLIDAAVTARVLVWDAEPGTADTTGTGRYRLPELPRDVVLSTQTASARQLRHAALARELAGRAGDEAAVERLARHLRAAGPMAPDMSPDVTPPGVTPHSPHPRSPR
ncbi:BTAD domain-containing putative transcriptional regulator [Streptomyces justiciae]|uniref:BTAD domain-containing putative transcriptional regulator n=1 Tax=Streptomyces justiciae TaxID=2780140 RepID=A0ABU3M4M9_9ACTN|nr:BTAD domain-containing putative transcriptional regulator [Streptomyces justiciae]MDT7846358.1 BTAD domain-containing putative transcriptional regulator [Streptomyces justiciae]